MEYNHYHYIYPPRPKNPIPSSELESYDNGTLLGQPKMDGSNSVISLNTSKIHLMNRHDQPLTGVQITNEIKSLYKGDGGWTVLNGEYLNKNKKDENNQPFNHKLVLFDILVYNGEYLVGKSFKERLDLMDQLFGVNNSEKSYLYSVSENVYRVKTYDSGFFSLYNSLTQIQVIEGLVLKRKNAKLEIGNTENNNTRSQIKCRRVTKNYKY